MILNDDDYDENDGEPCQFCNKWLCNCEPTPDYDSLAKENESK